MVWNHGNAPSQRCARGALYLVWRMGGITRKLRVHAPPALAAEVSLLAAMLGSLREAQDVLANRGVELDTKTVRLIAYRYGTRGRPPWLPPPWPPALLPCAKPPLHTITDMGSSTLPSPTVSTAYRMRDDTANSATLTL